MAKRPLYKKLKPFLASRFVEDPPQSASGEVTPESMIAWVLSQVARHFDKLGTYSVPPSIGEDALEYFSAMERRFEARIAAAMRIRAELDEIDDGVLHAPPTGDDFADMFPDIIKPPPPPPPPPNVPPNVLPNSPY